VVPLSFVPGLPDGPDEMPDNDAGSMASASDLPCSSSIASPTLSHAENQRQVSDG
ncbi:hypothetical protein ACVMFA_007162, partial [Bradyrhizobium liaoningense]